MPSGRVGGDAVRLLAATALALGVASACAGVASAATWTPAAYETMLGGFDPLDDTASQGMEAAALYDSTAQALSQYGVDFYASNGLDGTGPDFVLIYNAAGGIVANGSDWYVDVSFGPARSCDETCTGPNRIGSQFDLLRDFNRAPDPEPEAI